MSEEEFVSSLLSAALTVVTYVAAGVAAGLVLLVVFIGIKHGIYAFRVAKFGAGAGLGGGGEMTQWDRDFEAAQDRGMSLADAERWADDQVVEHHLNEYYD